MTTVYNSHSADNLHNLIERLNGFMEAGIDPAFDTECEELERQFAELRLSHYQH